jgi:hypothetical protein
MRRRVAGILVVVLCVLTAACSSGGSLTGTVQGRFQRVGGPAPGNAVPLPGVVIAEFSDGRRVVVHVPRDGRYRVVGPTGRVRLRGRSPLINRGRNTCPGGPSSVKATVKAAATVTADVICDIF